MRYVRPSICHRSRPLSILQESGIRPNILSQFESWILEACGPIFKLKVNPVRSC